MSLTGLTMQLYTLQTRLMFPNSVIKLTLNYIYKFYTQLNCLKAAQSFRLASTDLTRMFSQEPD